MRLPVPLRAFLSRGLRAAAACCCVALPLAGCSSVALRAAPPAAPVEAFDATDRFSRTVALGPLEACEAARLALLSQGYLVAQVETGNEMRARKNFQPTAVNHVQMEIRVVCADTVRGDEEHRSTVFVSAVQERYELKKSSNSASVGVAAIGSLSLPFSSGTDSMVKVASETVTAPRFYDRFFEVLDRFLDAPSRLPSEQAGAGLPALSEF